jgi:putative endopeptidase
MKKLKLIALMLFSLLLVTSCNKTEKPKEVKAIDTSNFDLSVKPTDNFYLYANGGWMKKHPIPKDKASYGTFTELADANDVKLKEIIKELTNSNPKEGTVEQKIADVFKTGMDSVQINKLGASPLKPILAKVDKIKNLKDLERFIEESTKNGDQYIFNFYGAPDNKNSEMNIPQLSQGGLGLPDKSYYFDKGAKADKIRNDYKKHIQKMLELTGVNADSAKQAANEIFDIELKLADASLSRVERRDVERTYNKMPLSDVQKLMKNFDWKEYFTAIGLKNPGEINVGMPDFFKDLDKILAQTDINAWKWYLKWHIISDNASFLSDDFVNQQFDFYGKELSGQKAMQPRWKRVLGTVNGLLGQALGKIYVKKYFPASSKQRMEKLISNLRAAFKERIKNLDWMTDSTKQKAIEKLAAITVKVGYPDKWKDYSSLEIKNDSYIKNIQRARKWNFEYMLNKINKPVDKTEWYMPPQMVNAYYNPANNEIVFPAGILQPPFFFANADDAVNYGAIGVVIGHEMTHGFDDQGRFFDKNGNMHNWWTKEDEKKFNERAQKLVDLFNQVTIIDTIKANGKLTLGENIADLGGLNISFTAFKNTKEYKEGKPIDGFTPAQRFFLAYAHIWAQNIRNQEKIRRTKIDVHSIGENRVNVQLRNMPAFQKAFNVKPGDGMYLPPDKMVKIW